MTSVCLCVYAVLSPVTATATLQLCMSPGSDMSVPQALAKLIMDQITVALSKQQVKGHQWGSGTMQL